MLREIVEANGKTRVWGSSPAGSWYAILDGNKVVGGKDPWKTKMSQKWFNGLIEKGQEKKFFDAVAKNDADKATDHFQVKITKIEGM